MNALPPIELLLPLVPLLPLASAVVIACLGPSVFKKSCQPPAAITVVAFGGAFLGSLLILYHVMSGSEPGRALEFVQTYWTWLSIPDAGVPAGGVAPDLSIQIALRADALTAMMLTMVTFVATLVAVFASGYMDHDRSPWRFFAYVSLFVFSMTMLVSVSNFLLLFVFWEAVGLCSYLLIGFWYEKPAAAQAGKKAFLVNRVGDFGFALGIFLIWTTYGTLNFHDTPPPVAAVGGEQESGEPQDAAGSPEGAEREDGARPGAGDGEPGMDGDGGELEGGGESSRGAAIVPGVLGVSRLERDYVAGGVALAICLLLLLGACGKSAQLPLHVWLPDAMEGPTPVSALIHAATMVTAGVYMVARCAPLFQASPEAQLVVAIVGAVTAVVAGVIAMTQFDLKRVLAYSTVSQLGYMFLALGAGSFAGITAGLFHLFTHAFFKALLFLGSGSVMHAMGNVIDMRRFGGLKTVMPVTRWTFLIGCLALSGVAPLAGFWSKDGIMAAVHARTPGAHHASAGHEAGPAPHGEASETGGEHDASAAAKTYEAAYGWLYLAALAAAFMTPFYTFRAYLLTFHGRRRIPAEARGHAHESPNNMTAPLVMLAFCAVFAGLFFDRTWAGGSNHFADFLASTPSLSHVSVAATRVPAEFHADIAAISTLICLLGIGAALYLYLGVGREVAWLTSVMRLEWTGRLRDVESVARLKQSPWVANTHRDFQRLHLGWLTSALGHLFLLLALILSFPLMLASRLSPYQLSAHKFYVDELYQFFIVQPLMLGARLVYLVDRFLVDGLVNAVGAAPRMLGQVVRSWQTGMVQFYALAMVVGVALLILAQWIF